MNQQNAASDLPPKAAALRSRASRGPGKCPSGIRGLDEITTGGLPRGRPTLLCGGAGCGKTLLAMEFLVRGAVEYGEPGIFIAFEESPDELIRNVASLGYDLRQLIASKLLFIEHIEFDHDIEAAGEFTLDGIFARLQHAVDQIKPKRIVLDTIENLLSGFPHVATVRSELRRLFEWMKDHELTAIVTSERGDGDLTLQCTEEYVSDCVILLDHRVDNQLATRRLRVVKYRGSAHGTDEYPFVIDRRGIIVVPVTSLELNQAAPLRRISSGIPHLDRMLGGKGYFVGSTVLICGGAGTGKTSFAAAFADRVCHGGGKAMYFAFEESMQQILRSQSPVHGNLKRWVDEGKLRFCCARPTLHGLEMHLARMNSEIVHFQPKVVVVDPITDLTAIGWNREMHAMLTRFIDFLKSRGLTTVLTGFSHSSDGLESASAGLSSLIDTWIELRNVETSGERNRTLFIRKARGVAYSNQVRQFHINQTGIEIIEPGRVAKKLASGETQPTGAQQPRPVSSEDLEAQIAALRSELDAKISALRSLVNPETSHQTRHAHERGNGARASKSKKAAKRL